MFNFHGNSINKMSRVLTPYSYCGYQVQLHCDFEGARLFIPWHLNKKRVAPASAKKGNKIKSWSELLDLDLSNKVPKTIGCDGCDVMSIGASCIFDFPRYFGRGFACAFAFHEPWSLEMIGWNQQCCWIHWVGNHFRAEFPSICLYTVGSHSTTRWFKATTAVVSTFQHLSTAPSVAVYWPMPNPGPNLRATGGRREDDSGDSGDSVALCGFLKQPWYVSFTLW